MNTENFGGLDPMGVPGRIIGIELGLAFVTRPLGFRCGGAIIAAKGSFAGGRDCSGTELVAIGVIGGGPMGLASSAGSSPGKTQTFFSLS